MAAERQADLTFDEVVLPLDHVLGDPGDGLRVLADALAHERVLAGALAAGIGSFCLHRGVERAGERELFSGPIGALQGVQHPLAAATADLAAARLLVRHAA
ncbi:MAG: acyl-CoA dehydrogenase family protein, partial [Acidimicrobiales bacterium]